MAGTFHFIYMFFLFILVPSLTVKVKVVTVKICAVKLHCFICAVNVHVKMYLSIVNFIFLKINGQN